METKIITYVKSAHQDTSKLDLISSTIPLRFSKIDTIHEIFPLLSDPSFHTDYIAVDFEDFYKTHGNKVFDFAHALSTLIDCTVCRIGSGKPQKRNTKILAIVKNSTHWTSINEILFLPEISYLIPDFTDKNVHENDILNELENVLHNGEKITRFVKKFKSRIKKINKSESEIHLTPRQSQILNIIMTRGSSNKIIAKMLGLSESTVKLHLGTLFKKYGVKTRTQLVLFARERQ